MTLQEIIGALEKSERPSRELDCAIMSALQPLTEPFLLVGRIGIYTKLPQAWGPTGQCVKNNVHQIEAPKITASVDAALDLCERIIPGAFWIMARGRTRADEPLYATQLLFGSDEILGEAEGNTLPSTIILAALRAKLQETTND